MNRFLFFLCLCIFSSVFSKGNAPFRFTHYTSGNGLPNEFILAIAQDDDRFIWFGTHLGIVRFDGYNFNLFQPDLKNKNSLSYKHVSKMFMDLHGNLWIKFTENALNRFETQTGKFFNYLSDTTPGNISNLRVNSFFVGQDSTLWIATKAGLNIYNNKEDNFYSVLPKFITKNTHPSNNINSLTDDTLGNIWVLSNNGIGKINRNDFKLKSLGEIVNRPEMDSMSITFLDSDHKTEIWFTTWNNGVFCYNIATGQLTNYLKDIKQLYHLFIDKKGNVFVYSDIGNTLFYADQQQIRKGSFSKYNLFGTTEHVHFLRFNEDKIGNIWISSSQGLDMFNNKNEIIHYKNNPLQEYSISTDIIYFTFIDHANNLWISNYRRGLDKADLNQKPFKKSFTNPSQSDNIFYGTNITAIMEDSQNNMWIGATGRAIIRYNKKTNSFKPVQVTDINQTTFSALFEDHEGNIWVGNYNKGIQRIDSKTLRVTYSSATSEWGAHKESISGVRKFVEDKNGDIWMTSRSGIHKWERKTGKIIPYSYIYDSIDPNHGFYRTVFIDKNGTLWSGSYNGGLARYNTQVNKVKRYINIPGDKTSISGNGIYVVFEESDSTFLIGTTLGLNRFNRITEQFSLVETKKSLYNYSIYTIIPDSLDNYWLATDNGLICLNKKTWECTFYNEGDGLPANEFNTTASCISHDGNIYLGSPNGLLSFNPNKFTKNPYHAHPIVTNLQINNITITPGDTLNGRVVLTKQIWATDILELKYFENDFALQFSAMHYAVPENNEFWYILEGYKNEWIATSANRRWASFTGLPPGRYKFRLKATNNDGVISKAEDDFSMIIKINPPFWATPWFKALIVIFIIAVILMYIRIRILRFKKSNMLLEDKVNERTRQLQNANISLREQQEEISSQKESLENTNETLRRTQEEIIAQNKELDFHRNKLESLVEDRTSELLKALKKAEESDRLKSSFLANMSHEIRTPMNAIVGFSMLLTEEDIDDQSKKKFVNTIIKNSQSLLVLIDDILDLSKIQSNQLTFNVQPQSIKSILNDIYQMFGIESADKKIDFRLNIEKIKDDLIIDTDKVRIKQVISNLVSNALKFTRKGMVEFGVFDVADALTIYVKDSGIGIPKEMGDIIFERFLKIEEDQKNVFRGAGLGLAISKSLVGLWGGRLWYESTENKGTTFFFTHPLKQKQTTFPTENTKQKFKTPDLKGANILIAEDEPSNYHLLFAYLKNMGANILWARNGQEACEIVNSNNIDIILMDIKMPVMSGIEAAKNIKQEHAEIPIIAQTAFTHSNYEELLSNKIFDKLITKPIKRAELFAAMADLI